MSSLIDLKLCECGCGEAAPVAPRTNRSKGWVKGKPLRFVRGHHARLPEVREKIGAAHSGEKSFHWKGEDVGYMGLHWRLWKHHEKSGQCSACGREGETEWANISGVYLTDFSDFAELCRLCHNELDDPEWYDKLH
jgi:hypothetical protein